MRKLIREMIKEMAWGGFIDNEKKRIAPTPDTEEIPYGGISGYGFPGAEPSETKEELVKKRNLANRYLKSKRTGELYRKYFSKKELKNINIYVMPYIGTTIEFFADLSNIAITADNLYDQWVNSDGDISLLPGIVRQLEKLYPDGRGPDESGFERSILPTYGGSGSGSIWDSGGSSRSHFIPFDSELGKKIFSFFGINKQFSKSDTVILPLISEYANNYRPSPWRVVHAMIDNAGPALKGIDPSDGFFGLGLPDPTLKLGVSRSFRKGEIQQHFDIAPEFMVSSFFFGKARFNQDEFKKLDEENQEIFLRDIEKCNIYAKELKEKMKGNIVLYTHY